MSEGRRTATVGTGVAALVAAAAATVAGVAGVLVVVLAASAGAVVLLLAALPPAPRRPPRLRRRARLRNAPYPSFRRFAEAVSYAHVSPRHFDLATRPALARLLAARLAEHDLPAAAGPRLVGPDAWRWLDPGRPTSRTSAAPGVPLDTVRMLVERIESVGRDDGTRRAA